MLRGSGLRDAEGSRIHMSGSGRWVMVRVFQSEFKIKHEGSAARDVRGCRLTDGVCGAGCALCRCLRRWLRCFHRLEMRPPSHNEALPCRGPRNTPEPLHASFVTWACSCKLFTQASPCQLHLRELFHAIFFAHASSQKLVHAGSFIEGFITRAS